MRYGVWTPLPHTIRPEPLMDEAIAESGTRGLARGPDKAFRFAADMIRRGEELGFETTLIAERWMGTDHSAWMLASALAALTSRIELMVAVHPGIMTPQAVAKLAVSLDRISGGRAAINVVNGWWKEEFETFGHGWQPQDDDARYRRMDEFVRVLRGLWQEDVFDFHGEFYTVDGQGLPLKSVQLPHPPIYAGTRNQLEEHGKTIANRVAFIAAKALGPGLVGTPEQIADRIRRYEAAGVGTLMMHFHPMMEGMERFAGRVMPLLGRKAA